ncbi:tail fiber protein [Neisseriaceae bacterium TC5R-5]|nr:tail fiber protein [Neisseriaceae bacterium TC5R-5]
MLNPIKPISGSSDNRFHDGDPGTGEMGTIVTATWLNDMQDATINTQQELLSVVKDSGQTVDAKRTDQLAQAIKKLAWNGTVRPTTLAGYGITDGATKTELDTKATKATTLAGYGISDAITEQQVLTLVSKPGCLVASFGTSPPAGTLACNGATVSRTTYAALFKVIGTRYGTGDGSTTFHLPNVPDGYALLGGTSSNVGGRVVGELLKHTHSAWTDSQGSHSHTVNDPGHSHSISFMAMDGTRAGSGSYAAGVNTGVQTNISGTGVSLNAAGAHGHNVGISETGGAANLAAGVKLLICISY